MRNAAVGSAVIGMVLLLGGNALQKTELTEQERRLVKRR